MLARMSKYLTKPLTPGRPKGSKTHDPQSSQAFGLVVRRLRQEKQISQEALATLAGIERAYMGRIERGETMPTLILILKIGRALEVGAGDILTETELLLASGKF